MLIFRLALLVGVIFGLYYLVNKVVTTLAKDKRCSRCEGKGMWRGVRGERNTCEWCGGTGRLPK